MILKDMIVINFTERIQIPVEQRLITWRKQSTTEIERPYF